MPTMPGVQTLLASLGLTLARDEASVVLVEHPSCPSPLPVACRLIEPPPGSPDPTPRFVPLALLLTNDALTTLLAGATPLHSALRLPGPAGPPKGGPHAEAVRPGEDAP